MRKCFYSFCSILLIFCILSLQPVYAYEFIPHEITQERMGDNNRLYSLSKSLLEQFGGVENIGEWLKHSGRKNTYLGPNAADLIDWYQLSNEGYLECFEFHRDKMPFWKMITDVLQYRLAEPTGKKADGTGVDHDVLYEKVYGRFYLYTFPYPLIYEIGETAYDEWREKGWETDVSGQQVNLPKLLNDFSITDEHFRELIAENQLEYFFTAERVEDVLRQRAWAEDIKVGETVSDREKNPGTGAC
jgi:hypothetical protein